MGRGAHEETPELALALAGGRAPHPLAPLWEQRLRELLENSRAQKRDRTERFVMFTNYAEMVGVFSEMYETPAEMLNEALGRVLWEGYSLTMLGTYDLGDQTFPARPLGCEFHVTLHPLGAAEEQRRVGVATVEEISAVAQSLARTHNLRISNWGKLVPGRYLKVTQNRNLEVHTPGEVPGHLEMLDEADLVAAVADLGKYAASTWSLVGIWDLGVPQQPLERTLHVRVELTRGRELLAERELLYPAPS